MEEGTTLDEEDQFNLLGGDLSDDSSDTTEMEIFDATQSSESLNTPNFFGCISYPSSASHVDKFREFSSRHPISHLFRCFNISIVSHKYVV